MHWLPNIGAFHHHCNSSSKRLQWDVLTSHLVTPFEDFRKSWVTSTWALSLSCLSSLAFSFCLSCWPPPEYPSPQRRILIFSLVSRPLLASVLGASM